MARPVNANADETRRKILEAASELFADNGFEGTSVRQIATGAGVSLGMIRHYFGSKEGLYRACFESAYAIYQQVGAQIDSALAAGGKPAEVIAQAARTSYRYGLENKAAFKLTLWRLMESQRWRVEDGDREMLPFILTVARALAEPLGVATGEAAMRLRTMIFLVARYATVDDDEIAYLLSDGKRSARASKRTLEAIEDHLAAVAERLFS